MNEAIKAILGRIGSRTIRGTVPLHPASYSSNDYSHPLPLLPHIATVTDTSACEEWQQSRTVPLCTEHASDPRT